MNPVVAWRQRSERNIIKKFTTNGQKAPGQPTVLIAAEDPEIRKGLADLLENYSINTIWVDSVEDAKRIIVTVRIATCFCGLWLQDGTYREIVRQLSRERMDIPAVIVSGPASPIEYRDYLAAMNIGLLDCLSYPYQQSDFEVMIESAVAVHSRGASGQAGQVDHDFVQSGAA